MTSDIQAFGTGEIYLYGILKHPVEDLARMLDGLPGTTYGNPHAISLAGTTVLVGAHDGSEILQTRRRMLAHTRVLEAAMAAAPLLPMCFGLVAESVSALEALLTRHRKGIEAQFERIEGCVEIGLRVSFPRDAALAAILQADTTLSAARDRLAGRGAEAHFDRIEIGRRVADRLDERRTQAQQSMIRALAPHCSSHVLKAPEDDIEVLRAECLIGREHVEDFATMADTLARASGFAPSAEPDIQLIGPVPPYNFVDLALVPPKDAEWA